MFFLGFPSESAQTSPQGVLLLRHDLDHALVRGATAIKIDWRCPWTSHEKPDWHEILGNTQGKIKGPWPYIYINACRNTSAVYSNSMSAIIYLQ